MNVRTLRRSFAGGEITPELYGRLDLTKFQTGLATCRNFIVLPHGPAANRAGFEYTLEVKDSTKRTRLIPFSYSTTQTFVLEFGHLYVRFHTQGGTLVEAAKVLTAITQANPGVASSAAHGFANGDTLLLAAINGMAPLNNRWVKAAGVAAGTFQLTDLGGSNINTTAFPPYVSAGTASRVYEVVTPYTEADLFDLHYTQSADVLTIVHPNYAPRELRRLGATNWALTTITFTPSIAAPTGVAVVATGAGGVGTRAFFYSVTAVAADGVEESIASAVVGCGNDLTVLGQYNTITWAAVAGASLYNIYRLSDGVNGSVGATTGLSFVDINYTPDATKTAPMALNPFATDFPGAVGYFEQRRVFAGTTLKPQNVWMTRSATERNLSSSIPTRDADAIAFRIAGEANIIRHIVPLADLVVASPGGTWKIVAQNTDVLTPSSVAPKPQGREGANNVQPVLTGSAALYAHARGGRMRELVYSWENNGYKTSDITLMAPHLFDPYQIVDLTYVRAPNQIMWAVSSSGKLLGMTYIPEQQVLAWHQHDTDGVFESVAAVIEGNEDALYAVIKRTVNARTVRYVERMHSRFFVDAQDAFFVDAGATYDGAPVSVLTGLHHLEGKTVAILADGAVQPPKLVTAGAITLEHAASVVQIGLAITADLQTLPLTLETSADGGQGREKNVNKVYLRVYRSSGIFVGPAFDKLVEAKQRTTESYGVAPALRSEEMPIMVKPNWSKDAQLCVRQSDPLPLTILSMTLDVAVGG
jgi:hypothetical protein